MRSIEQSFTHIYKLPTNITFIYINVVHSVTKALVMERPRDNHKKAQSTPPRQLEQARGTRHVHDGHLVQETASLKSNVHDIQHPRHKYLID